MTPYYADDSVTLWRGDTLDVLRTMPDASVDCAVTSPPYYGLRDYGEPGQYGLEPSPAEYVETMRRVFAEVRRVLAHDGTLWLNLGDSYSGSWGNQGRKEERGTQRPIAGPMLTPVHDGRHPDAGTRTGAIKPGAPAAKNLMGIPWRVAFALQDDGWYLRNAITWHKPNAMPHSVTDRLSNRSEMVFLFSRSPRYWFDLDAIREPHEMKPQRRPQGRPEDSTPRPGQPRQSWSTATRDEAGVDGHPLGRNPGDVWSIATSQFPEAHFATMPPALAERGILAGCRPGGTVLDPFAGSCTTGMAAGRLGRRFVGIDLSAKYLDLALRTRLAQGALLEGAA